MNIAAEFVDTAVEAEAIYRERLKIREVAQLLQGNFRFFGGVLLPVGNVSETEKNAIFRALRSVLDVEWDGAQIRIRNADSENFRYLVKDMNAISLGEGEIKRFNDSSSHGDSDETLLRYVLPYLIPDSNRMTERDVRASLVIMQHAALQSMGYGIRDFEKLPLEKRMFKINRIVNGMRVKERVQYMTRYNDIQSACLNFLAPFQLIDLERALKTRVGTAAGRHEREDAEARLTAVRERMLELVRRCGQLEFDFPLDTIPDMCPNMYFLASHVRQTQSDAFSETEYQNVSTWLKSKWKMYDIAHNLHGLTQDDARVLGPLIQVVTGHLKHVKEDKDNRRLLKLIRIVKASGDTRVDMDVDKSLLVNATKCQALQELLFRDRRHLTRQDCADCYNSLLKSNLATLIIQQKMLAGKTAEEAERELELDLRNNINISLREDVVAGFLHMQADTQTAFIRRLTGKLGEKAPALPLLYQAIRSFDTLAKQRYKTSYARASTRFRDIFWLNTFRSAGYAAASIVLAALGGTYLAAGCAAGYAAVRLYQQHREQVREATQRGAPKPKFWKFLKNNIGAIAITTVSTIGVAFGLDGATYGALALNKLRSTCSAWVESRRNGDSWMKTMGRVALSGTQAMVVSAVASPLSAWVGNVVTGTGELWGNVTGTAPTHTQPFTAPAISAESMMTPSGLEMGAPQTMTPNQIVVAPGETVMVDTRDIYNPPEVRVTQPAVPYDVLWKTSKQNNIVDAGFDRLPKLRAVVPAVQRPAVRTAPTPPPSPTPTSPRGHLYRVLGIGEGVIAEELLENGVWQAFVADITMRFVDGKMVPQISRRRPEIRIIDAKRPTRRLTDYRYIRERSS